jgi:hypothetical protein
VSDLGIPHDLCRSLVFVGQLPKYFYLVLFLWKWCKISNSVSLSCVMLKMKLYDNQCQDVWKRQWQCNWRCALNNLLWPNWPNAVVLVANYAVPGTHAFKLDLMFISFLFFGVWIGKLLVILPSRLAQIHAAWHLILIEMPCYWGRQILDQRVSYLSSHGFNMVRWHERVL